MRRARANLRRLVPLLTVVLLTPAACRENPPITDPLESSFEGGRGQLQVGGPFAGAEFHLARPLPSRVSFYYPVANSIDLSTDYWRRHESMPFSASLTVDGRTGSIGDKSFAYRSTPSHAIFEQSDGEQRIEFAYYFGETLPVMVLRMTITNQAKGHKDVVLGTRMKATLRTSHAYNIKSRAWTSYDDAGTFLADYDDAEAASPTVFVANAGHPPTRDDRVQHGQRAEQTDPEAVFTYGKRLGPGDSLEVVQIIGSCPQPQSAATVQRALDTWREDTAAYERRVTDYAVTHSPFELDDASLLHTERWSKALLQADQHYIDGRIVPMPTPAQYNFFFTHDLQLTDLGAVLFDTDRVKRDLLYLKQRSEPAGVLAHAYYWRDDGYKTETANADNWNHLWFVLLTGSYYRHSADKDTVELLFPMIRNSLRIMLGNEHDGLMFAERPDWWDIGQVYGERAYLTALTIRALREYAYLSLELGHDDPLAREYLDLSRRMNEQLVARLWDAEAGYLLNKLDGDTLDRHYYSGSLIAAAFGLLDPDTTATLLETAREELLDEKIGIRNAMPPDFHELADRYHFNGPEVGEPYQYMNGGVWPQGNAWYVMALLANGQPDAAKDALHRYMTLDGIRNSPGGQPALYEYRNADPGSPMYGQIDKTTFLWAGGWYLYSLYHVIGVRENEWNISFNPHLPKGTGHAAYDLMLHGTRSRVTWSGNGRYFKTITLDGRRAHSAVMVGPVSTVALQRGTPDAPYLASASGIVRKVDYNQTDRHLDIVMHGIPGQVVEISVVTPTPLRRALTNGIVQEDGLTISQSQGIQTIGLRWMLETGTPSIRFEF